MPTSLAGPGQGCLIRRCCFPCVKLVVIARVKRNKSNRPRRQAPRADRSGHPGPAIKPSDFIARNPVFRFDELLEAHTASGRSPQTTAALLRYHVRTGRLAHLRRGLYATRGPIDPWVLGSRLARDAVLAYDGALSFHGLTGLGHGISFLTTERVGRFAYCEVVYLPVKPPAAVAELADWGGGLVELERAGQRLKVTSKERTLVEVLDRIDLAPSPGELRECFAEVGPLDVELMVRHARLLGNRLAAARLGFFLEQHRSASPADLRALERLRPSGTAYFDRRNRRKGDSFIGRWNLIVPRELL